MGAAQGAPAVTAPEEEPELSHKLTNDVLLEISKEQSIVIKKSWGKTKPTKPGKNISADILEKSPEIQPLIEKGMEIVREKEALKKSVRRKSSRKAPPTPVFKDCHAAIYDKVINLVITNLENLGPVAKQLEEYGAGHTRFRKIGFESKHFALFADVALDHSFKWCERSDKTAEVYEAWSLIMMYITQKLRDGYMHESRRLMRRKLSELTESSSLIAKFPKIPRPLIVTNINDKTALTFTETSKRKSTEEDIPAPNNDELDKISLASIAYDDALEIFGKLGPPSPVATSTLWRKPPVTYDPDPVSSPTKRAIRAAEYDEMTTLRTCSSRGAQEINSMPRKDKMLYRSTSHLLHSDSSVESAEPSLVNLSRYVSKKSQQMYFHDEK